MSEDRGQNAAGRRFAAPLRAMAESKFLVAPSEFNGEGWLTGRPVLRRLVDLSQSGSKDFGSQALSTWPGKAKSGGKGKKGGTPGERMKCEVHLLGGQTRGEVVFCEAWGEAAGKLDTVAKECEREEKLLCVSNVKIVNQYNQYSTSRLPYYVRFVLPQAQAEKVAAEGRWADISLHHPFLDIEKMMKVEWQQQHCVVGARCQTRVKLYLPRDIEAFA